MPSDHRKLGLLSRDRRKPTVRLLAAKGLSSPEIAAITGWSPSSIQRDLRVIKAASNDASNDAVRPPATGSAEPDPDRARNDERAANGIDKRRQFHGRKRFAGLAGIIPFADLAAPVLALRVADLSGARAQSSPGHDR